MVGNVCPRFKRLLLEWKTLSVKWEFAEKINVSQGPQRRRIVTESNIESIIDRESTFLFVV